MGGWLYRTIRWKFIFAFAGSIAITLSILFFLLFVGPILKRIEPIRDLLVLLLSSIGVEPVLLISGCVLFLVLFFLLSNQMIRYLKEITDGLQHIAHGNLDYEIPVRSSDELGEVAYNINQMSRRLSASIEEERLAEKTKNDLITGVSHDLRTPLTSILGFLELIENDRYKDEVELRYYVGIAYEKSIALKKLIDDLFDFTRLNNGMPIEKFKLDLDAFFRQLLEEFVPSLEAAGMAGRIQSDYQPLHIMADGDRLVRAFENLITNAILYGGDGHFVDIRLRAENGFAVVEVVNYGEPIPEKDLPYLFDRFYRVEQSRSKQTGGTGLGLAIVKSIVDLHDGFITVRSGHRETVFETRFPLAIESFSAAGYHS
ncbi:sensor histidine kinase [Paenibacillus beijingensis]|uniref:histidine kinase n=1 Tax=Paenibacillus beijingensis TaxID=1126833 RepID=A0A0D5NR82_9BACL|nr:histidine kinase [Paenibacillus beijingensis]